MAYEKLSKGSTGSGVRKLQETLNRNGYSLSVDGVYGDKTQSAVRDYQRKKKLAADGIAGEATWQKLRSGEAELPVVTPTYEVMGNGGAAVQSVRATGTTQATQSSGKQSYYNAPAAQKNDAGEYGYDPSGNSAYQEALKKLKEMEGSRPEYAGTYDRQLQDIYDKIMNREKFSYDAAKDPLYQQYRDQYVLQGKQAMMDTMGQAAGLTGGYGSTYSQSAGQQQYDAYLQKLNEVIPELYGQARQAYADEVDRMLQQYQLTGDLRDDEYSRYKDALEQYWQGITYQTGRADTAYSQGAENWWNSQTAQRQDKEFAYQQKKDAYSNLVTLIGTTGYTPSQSELEAAGMSAAEAARWKAYYDQQRADAAAAQAARYASSAGGSGSGGRQASSSAQKSTAKAQAVSKSSNRIYVPGYGEITYNDAEMLEKQGYIILQGTDKNGKPVYARSTKKNYNKPTKMTV